MTFEVFNNGSSYKGGSFRGNLLLLYKRIHFSQKRRRDIDIDPFRAGHMTTLLGGVLGGNCSLLTHYLENPIIHTSPTGEQP